MTEERRRYYRIEEQVMIALAQIDAGELDARLEDFWSNELALAIRHDFNHQIALLISDRRKIEKKNARARTLPVGAGTADRSFKQQTPAR